MSIVNKNRISNLQRFYGDIIIIDINAKVFFKKEKFIKKETLIQLFSCEFCEILRKLPVTSSGDRVAPKQLSKCSRRNTMTSFWTLVNKISRRPKKTEIFTEDLLQKN